MTRAPTLNEYLSVGRKLRRAAERGTSRTASVKLAGRAERDAYARLGVLAGLSGKTVDQVERLVKSGDYASLHPLAEEVITTPGYDLWQQVVKGSNASLKGKVVDEASKHQPALSGTSGEDMAQVMSVGGLKWPGKRFDSRLQSFPDAKPGSAAAKAKGRYVEREEPVFPRDWNIFMEAGERGRSKAKDLGWFSQTLFRIAQDLVRRWVRSVDAGKYIPLPEREREMELTVPGYKGPGDMAAMNLSNPYFIKAISDKVSRMVAGKPAQSWLWGVITQAADKGNNPFVRPTGGTPPLSLEATKLLKWVEDNDYPEAPGGRRSVAKAWNKLYKVMVKAYDELSVSEIEKGIDRGEGAAAFRDPAVRDVYLQEIRRRRASAHRVAARRVAEKWIQQAIEKPGRLHKFFGIPEDEDIPVAKIKGEIAKLKKKGERSTEETSLLRALNMALTLKGMDKGASPTGSKKAALGPVSLGEMMLSAASQIRLFHNLEGAYDRYLGVYEEMGQNLVRLGHTTDPEDRSFLVREIDSGLKYLRGRAGEIHRAAEALRKLADAYDLVAKAYR